MGFVKCLETFGGEEKLKSSLTRKRTFIVFHFSRGSKIDNLLSDIVTVSSIDFDSFGPCIACCPMHVYACM
jgi:hypothetical protein